MEYENTGIDGEPTFTASVLILVLMEYENTGYISVEVFSLLRLNPCFNGIRKYSRSESVTFHRRVLILVLMEYENTLH